MVIAVPFIKDITISGINSFFQTAKDLLDDLQGAGLPIKKEELKDSVAYEDPEYEGSIQIVLEEPVNKVKHAFFTIVNAPECTRPTIQRLEVKRGSSELKSLSVMLSSTHPDFKTTLRNEIEALTGKLSA